MSWTEDPGVDIFNGLDLTKLGTDQAYVRLNSSWDNSWLYSLSSDCYNCPYTKVTKINSSDDVITVDVAHAQLWRVTSRDLGDYVVQNTKSNVLCDMQPDMGEFGIYKLNVENDSCEFSIEKEAVNIYLPILIIFFIILGIVSLWKLIQLLVKKYFKEPGKDADAKPETVKKRVKSLDTFRGMSIVLMIFVNDGGGRYWWMEHATWNGLTVGDLVFPFFLWIMGVCIPMSVKGIISRDLSKKTALLNIFRRSCTLFLIGVALGSIFGPFLHKLRIFGVLQRFGICYWIVASLAVILGKKRKEPEGKYSKMFKDISEIGVQWIIMLCIVFLHVIVLHFAPVPGCPTGYMGPGGKQDNWKYKDCIGGITKHIDVAVLGDSHLYQNPTAKFVYESGSFDPEGVFGCLLSIVHVFLGLQAGNTLQHFKKWKPLISRWLLWAAVTGLIGGILCNFSKEEGVIPVNKNLWSLSFVLVTTCFAFIILSAFYMLVDVFEWWDGSPFIQPGMNAITMYVGHSICHSMFPFHWAIPNMKTHLVYLLESSWGTMLWILVAFQMARKKVFVTV